MSEQEKVVLLKEKGKNPIFVIKMIDYPWAKNPQIIDRLSLCISSETAEVYLDGMYQVCDVCEHEFKNGVPVPTVLKDKEILPQLLIIQKKANLPVGKRTVTIQLVQI